MNSKSNSSRGRQPKKETRKSNDKPFNKERSFRNKPIRAEKTPSTKNTTRNKPIRAEKTPTSKNTTTKESDTIRLNKYIANSGMCSRREADVFIKSGSAMVNGKMITEMGYQVKPTDEVRFDGVLINPETKRYILLNKPKNYITTMDDDRGRKTVMDLVVNAAKERIYPVGRLDRNTTGLLLFTNDGELAKKLTHPKHNIQKIYHASLDKKLAMSDLQKIAEGFVLDGKTIKVDEISYIQGEPKKEIGVKIHSGRNRIVRRIFEHHNYKVVKLDRVIFAGLTKKDLPRGHWRKLTEQEVINLKMI